MGKKEAVIIGGSIALIVLAVALGGVFLKFIIEAGLEQTYSPYQKSLSIEEAR